MQLRRQQQRKRMQSRLEGHFDILQRPITDVKYADGLEDIFEDLKCAVFVSGKEL